MLVNLYEIVNLLFCLCSQFGRLLVASTVLISSLATVELSRLVGCIVLTVHNFTFHQSVGANFIVEKVEVSLINFYLEKVNCVRVLDILLFAGNLLPNLCQ